MVIGTIAVLGAAAIGGQAASTIQAGKQERRGLRRQSNLVLRNAQAEIQANTQEAKLRASQQRAQFAAAGVETTGFGTPRVVQEEDLLRTLDENQQINTAAVVQATNLRKAGSRARDAATIQAGTTAITKTINLASSLAGSGGFGGGSG